jgi:rhomboid family GlyGly-CTERM serine protease
MISGLPRPQWPDEARHVARRDLAVFAVLAAAVLGLEAGGETVRVLLRFDREPIVAGEYWRLITGHLVHLGWGHALLNLAALGLVIASFRPLLGWSRWTMIALAAATAIDLGLWFSDPPVTWYVGLSGVLHGLVAAAAIALIRFAPRMAVTVLAILTAKLAWEAFRGALPFTAELSGGDVIVEAHLWGAVGGVVAALLLTGLRRRSAPL